MGKINTNVLCCIFSTAIYLPLKFRQFWWNNTNPDQPGLWRSSLFVMPKLQLAQQVVKSIFCYCTAKLHWWQEDLPRPPKKNLFKHTKNILTNCGALFYTVCENTVKPVLSGDSKIDKTMILMTNGSIMNWSCSSWSILQYFGPALSDNWYWKPILVFF